MSKILLREIVLVIFAAVPVLVGYFYWDQLPAEIPSHINFRGEVDNTMAKDEFMVTSMAVTFGLYLLTLVIPYIDPKGQIKKMGTNYFKIRLILIGFMGLIFTALILSTVYKSLDTSSLIYTVVFLLIAVIGNYFQSIKPNYFIGIRTPWTLESERNWTLTHRFAGRFWVIIGIVVVMFTLFTKISSTPYFLALAVIPLAIVPFAYSFVLYLLEKNKSAENSE